MAESDLQTVLRIVRHRQSVTAKSIAFEAEMELATVQRSLRELERRNLVASWKRPGSRSLLWRPNDPGPR